MKYVACYLLLLSFWLAQAGMATPPPPKAHIIAPKIYSIEDEFRDFSRQLQAQLHDPYFMRDVLTHDMSTLVRALEMGSKMRETKSYVLSVFKIFTNRVKGTPYINGFMFEHVLEQLPLLIKSYFVPYKSFSILRSNYSPFMETSDRLQKTFSQLMYQQFNSNYDDFKVDPEQFLNNLSNSLVEIAQDEVSTELLRQNVIRFIELSVNKMIWTYDKPEEAWDSVKNIAYHLRSLFECNIIEDIDDLDDLCWSIVHRFNYFLDLTGEHISLAFYEHIKNDIATKQLLLLELEEQDVLFESKKDTLLQAIASAECKRRVYEPEIVVAEQPGPQLHLAATENNPVTG